VQEGELSMSGKSYSFIAAVFFGGSDVVVEHPV
jgi:hypothetical protein